MSIALEVQRNAALVKLRAAEDQLDISRRLRETAERNFNRHAREAERARMEFRRLCDKPNITERL